jgi:hypothetical protein
MDRAMPARFLHAAGQFGRHVPGERLQPDQLEFHARDEIDRIVGKVGPDFQRQARVFQQRHRTEQRSRLVHHAEFAPDREQVGTFGGDDVRAVDPRLSCKRRKQPDHVLEQRALAAAGSAQDAEHLPAGNLEVDVLQDGRRAFVAGVHRNHADDGSLFRALFIY